MSTRQSAITLYSFSFQHHGRYSSFHRLLHYARGCCIIDATFPLRGFLNQTWRERLEQRWLRWSERRLRTVFARNQRQCVHYIHPENSLFQGGLWKGRHGLVLTCHQPGERLRQIAGEPAFQGFIQGLKQADRVVLLATEFLKEYQEFCPPEHLAVVLHGIDVDFFRPASTPPQHKLVLTVGNWLRDYELWAELTIRLARKMPDLEFAVVALPKSVGSVRNRVEDALGPRVRFLHGLADKQLRQLYHEATVVFLPLKAAGANNALLEALACGVPVLVSDLPASRKYAGESALFFKSGVIEEAQSALERLLSDRNQCSALAQAGRARAVNSLAWSVIVERYQALYSEVLNADLVPQSR